MSDPRTVSGVDPGSFRDPSGRVIIDGGRVFRTIEPHAQADFAAVWSAGILSTLMSSGRVVATTPVDEPVLHSRLSAPLPPSARRIVEHERIPFISYPYEWPYALLKRAALHHLELHLDLLDAGFTLSDGSAYNVQFRGTTPVFIDLLSIRPYHEGAYWAGYRQFCEQFLNPLLFGAYTGVSYLSWYRGSLEGIAVEDMARLLPARARWSWRVLLHVVMHARMDVKGRKAQADGTDTIRTRPMSKPALVWMLKSLHRWIRSLQPRSHGQTTWGDYTALTSYATEEAGAKRAFVTDYISRTRPTAVMDVGCNTGVYAEVALQAGARRVIGLDYDSGALEAAVSLADAHSLDLLPLCLDTLNPSPDQGWAQRERQGLERRATGDGLLGLALLHHMAIGRNVPLAEAVRWLVGLAPTGVIEFVPKADPMVQRMLRHREDIFPGYAIEAFREALGRDARTVREQTISASGRTLFEYCR